MEIKDLPVPEGFEKIPIHLYGIVGWFFDNGCNAPFSFAGYFKRNPSTGLILDSQLIDSLGSSQIGGKMIGDILAFGKKYDNREEIINYRFEKKENLWVGRYFGYLTGEGESKCLTTLLEEDAFNLACGSPLFGDLVEEYHNFWINYAENLDNPPDIYFL
jgi:hypothetical protein